MNFLPITKFKIQIVKVKRQIVFMLIAFLGISNLTVSAQGVAESIVTIKMKEATLLQVFNNLESQTDYKFAYSDDISKDTRTMELDFTNKKLSEVLSELSKKAGFEYNIADKKVSIRKLNKKTVSGKLTDSETGEALIGATVKVEGTSQGTVTDVDGNYTIDVYPNSVLNFSYVGYETIETEVNGESSIDLTLTPGATDLDEVVVVGYGVEKKVNLTGAVDQVDGEVFENRSITNVSQGLVGIIPNLNITMLDGKPTQSPTFNVRGITSIGQGGSALVLIDGVEGDPALLNPNDIESVSVLKDAASASIYGARAAFGVILITTKQPTKDKMSIKYTTNQSMKVPTNIPDYVTDGYVWASHFSDAYDAWNDYTRLPTKINKTQPFSPEYLEELKRRHDDPSLSKYAVNPITNENIYYGSTDWYDLLYKDRTYYQDHNLHVTGVSERMAYYVSGRMSNQNGLFRYNSDDYKMLNLRSKVEMKLNDWLSISNNTEFANMYYHNPINVGEGGGIWRNIADEGHPTSMMFNEDGTLTHSAAYTVGDFWYGKNGQDTYTNMFKNNTTVEAGFFDEKLTVNSNFAYQLKDNTLKRTRVPVPYSRTNGVIAYTGTTKNDYRTEQRELQNITFNLYSTYQETFNDAHNVKILIGANYEEFQRETETTQRNGLLFPDASDFNLAFGDAITLQGGYQKWKYFGVFSRINYNFKERYLFEINGRYDGSSKFPEDSQYEFFPSASVAWRISKEDFFNVSDAIVSNFKIRASYGELGNGSISPYQFVQSYTPRLTGRIISGANPLYFRVPTELPQSLTWETAITSNIGVDLGLFNYKLDISGDYYQRETIDMFTTALTPPSVYGGSAPKGNYADLMTSGWELSVRWKDSFQTGAGGPFNYSVGINLSDSKSEITKYNNPDKLLSDYYEGMIIGEIWGLETYGLFKSEEEIANAPDQSFIRNSSKRILLPGDVRFVDSNNDDKIDYGSNTVDDPGDLSVIGNSEPRYIYSINLSADWKNFYINTLFRGTLKQDWWPDKESRFWGQYNRPYNDIPTWHLDNMWSKDNPDAYLPRLRGYTARSGRAQNVPQTRYQQDVKSLIWQNLQVGYRLPTLLANKILAKEASIYFSAENLASWSPLYKYTRDTNILNIYGSDRDLTSGTSGGEYNYPTMASYTLGLSITF